VSPEGGEKDLEVGRRRGIDGDPLSVRLLPAEVPRVQRLTGERNRERRELRVAVDRVANQRVSRMGEMDADLVGPAGLQPGLDERRDAEPLNDLPLGDRPDPGLAGFRHPAPPVPAVLDEVLAEDPFFARHVPLHDRPIAAVHRVGAELGLELDEPLMAPGEGQDAGRLLVETVDDRDVGASLRPLGSPRRNAGEERVLLLGLGRMGEEPGGLHDGDRVVVLVEDLDRRVDPPDDPPVRIPLHPVGGRHDRAGVVDFLAVDRDLPVQDGPFEARRRDARVERSEGADDAEGGRGGVGRLGIGHALSSHAVDFGP
jgi:hypothetical protein